MENERLIAVLRRELDSKIVNAYNKTERRVNIKFDKKFISKICNLVEID